MVIALIKVWLDNYVLLKGKDEEMRRSLGRRGKKRKKEGSEESEQGSQPLRRKR